MIILGRASKSFEISSLLLSNDEFHSLIKLILNCKPNKSQKFSSFNILPGMLSIKNSQTNREFVTNRIKTDFCGEIGMNTYSSQYLDKLKIGSQ